MSGDMKSELAGIMASMISPEALAMAEEYEREEAGLRGRRAQQVERAKRNAVAAVLPPALGRAVLGDIQASEAVSAVRDWVAGKDRLLLLRGGVGVGKSLAAAVAVRDVVFAGDSASWHRPNTFVSAVMHGYDANAPRLGKDLVVVDDLGRDTKRDFDEAMCAFVDDFDARVILTTNLSKEAFRERYDVRLIDRLNDVGIAVTIKGESRRRKGGGF